MVQETITIKFSKTGDEELIQTLNDLAKAQNKLNGATGKLAKEQKKANKGMLGLNHSARQTSGAFSVLRSKLLLFNFAMALGIRQLSKFTKESAKVDMMERGFKTLIGATENSAVAFGKLQKATDFTMSKFDLFQQANNAMILGVS